MQDELPGALAKAFASHMAPGDPSGQTLSVTINSVILQSVGPSGSATDWMIGVATLGGRHTKLRPYTSGCRVRTKRPTRHSGRPAPTSRSQISATNRDGSAADLAPSISQSEIIF